MLAYLLRVQNQNVTIDLRFLVYWLELAARHFVKFKPLGFFFRSVRLSVGAMLWDLSLLAFDMLFKQVLETFSFLKLLLVLTATCHVDISKGKLLSHCVEVNVVEDPLAWVQGGFWNVLRKVLCWLVIFKD